MQTTTAGFNSSVACQLLSSPSVYDLTLFMLLNIYVGHLINVQLPSYSVNIDFFVLFFFIFLHWLFISNVIFWIVVFVATWSGR
jgi:hypothetical protein